MPPRKTTDAKTDAPSAPDKTSAVATRSTHALAGFTPDQVQLIKDTVAKGTTDSELAYFLEVAKATGLNPFKRQIHAVMRWDSRENRQVMSIQTGIDGYRKMAEDSGLYMPGAIEWCGQDGSWTEVWLRDVPPSAARATVFRSDMRDEHGALMPIRATALWKSYVQTTSKGETTRMWAQHGPLMLGKCAEALAIRRAFPDRTSGLYTDDEMAQAEPGDAGAGTAAAKGGGAPAPAPIPVAAKAETAPSAAAPTPSRRTGFVETAARPLDQAAPPPQDKALSAEQVKLDETAAPSIVGRVAGGAPIEGVELSNLIALGRTSDKGAREHFYETWLPERGYAGADVTARWQSFIRAGSPHYAEAVAYFTANAAPVAASADRP